MSVRLFVLLVFITQIVASDYHSTSEHKSASKYNVHNPRNTRILITESLNDSPSGTVQITNTTENKTNSTDTTLSVIPVIKEDDKNGTVTKKPEGNKEVMETQGSQIVNSYPPYNTYEVTENVIDIPDDRTPVGPIVPNFTHMPPILNLAKPTNKTIIDKTTESSIKPKKNCVSILHINAEFDDKVHVVHDNKFVGLLKGIKKYINGFQRGVANSFHSLFHKHHGVHEHGERFERAVYNEDGSDKSEAVEDVDKVMYNVHQRRISVT